MRVFFLVAAIVCIVLSVLSLLLAVLNLFGYYNVLDGSSELYSTMRLRAVIFFIAGAVLQVVSAVFFIIRANIH